MAFPCTHFSPASITDHLEESIIIGTLATSGSEATMLRKRVMAFSESSIASSMFTSMICAPFSTCWRATTRASSYFSSRMSRANCLEPLTLVRSPILIKLLPLMETHPSVLLSLLSTAWRRHKPGTIRQIKKKLTRSAPKQRSHARLSSKECKKTPSTEQKLQGRPSWRPFCRLRNGVAALFRPAVRKSHPKEVR